MDVVVLMAGGELEVLRIGIVRIRAVSDDEIAVAGVHDDGVEAENPAVAATSDGAFDERA
jgi:hypothetical protein